MDHETMRSLIGTILLWAMAIAAAAWLIWKNRALIREICWNENGKFDPLGGLERYFAQSGQDEDPDPDTVTADEDFMALLMKQKGAQMAGFDPERDRIREHIIFRAEFQEFLIESVNRLISCDCHCGKCRQSVSVYFRHYCCSLEFRCDDRCCRDTA